MSILYYYSITGLSLQVFVIGHLVSYRHSTHYDQSLILYNSFMKQVSSVKGDFYVLLLSWKITNPNWSIQSRLRTKRIVVWWGFFLQYLHLTFVLDDHRNTVLRVSFFSCPVWPPPLTSQPLTRWHNLEDLSVGKNYLCLQGVFVDVWELKCTIRLLMQNRYLPCFVCLISDWTVL